MSRHLGGYLLFAAVSVSLWSADIPVAQSVEPRNGAPGTTLTIKGTFLDKEKVEEVYLTDHRFDLKVKVLEQDVNHLKIRIPPFAKPGRHQLLFLAKGTDKIVYLEQPVYIQVEEAAEAAAAAPAAPAEPAPASVAPVPPPAPAPALTAAETTIVQQNGKPRNNNADSARRQKADRRKAEEPKKAKATETREVAAVQAPPARPEPTKPAQAEPPAAPLQTEAAKPVGAAGNSPAPDSAAPAAAARVTTPVQVVKQSPPTYPQMARQMRIAGVVSLEVAVSAEGKVERVKIVDGHPLLNDAAANAVKNWGYRAATLQGQPVAGTIPISVRFNLPR